MNGKCEQNMINKDVWALCGSHFTEKLFLCIFL